MEQAENETIILLIVLCSVMKNEDHWKHFELHLLDQLTQSLAKSSTHILSDCLVECRTS